MTRKSRRILFLSLAIMAAFSLVLLGLAFAFGSTETVSLSFTLWIFIMGLSFLLKRKLSKTDDQE